MTRSIWIYSKLWRFHIYCCQISQHSSDISICLLGSCAYRTLRVRPWTRRTAKERWWIWSLYWVNEENVVFSQGKWRKLIFRIYFTAISMFMWHATIGVGSRSPDLQRSDVGLEESSSHRLGSYLVYLRGEFCRGICVVLALLGISNILFRHSRKRFRLDVFVLFCFHQIGWSCANTWNDMKCVFFWFADLFSPMR